MHTKTDTMQKFTPIKITGSGWQMLLVFLACLPTISCNISSPSSKNSSSPAPVINKQDEIETKLQKEAQKAALDFVKNLPECKKEKECKKFNVVDFGYKYRSPINPSSEADFEDENGVKGSYFVRIAYIYRPKESAEWNSGLRGLICTKTREVWGCRPALTRFDY